LYTAIRPDKPPEVTRAVPYTKTRTTAQKKSAKPTVITKRVTTRSHLEEIKPSNNNQTHTVADKTGAQNLKLTLYLRHMSATFVAYTI